MGTLYVIGIGPGGLDHMSIKAMETIKSCDIIVGYNKYIDMIKDIVIGKEIFQTGMMKEKDRCVKALELSRSADVALVSTGDSGIYGMAGLILELRTDEKVKVIPGITASSAAGSVLGAPLMHDNCNISLSDLMTSYDKIKKRIKLAAEGDFIISLYNPKSKGRPHYLMESINIIREYRNPKTPIAVVTNALRDGEEVELYTLENFDDSNVGMMSIVVIGNSESYYKDGCFITPRGYNLTRDKEN